MVSKSVCLTLEGVGSYKVKLVFLKVAVLNHRPDGMSLPCKPTRTELGPARYGCHLVESSFLQVRLKTEKVCKNGTLRRSHNLG